MDRPAGIQWLVHLPYRWVVETNQRLERQKDRRNSKDYERTASSSAAMIKASTIHLMLYRLRSDRNAKIATFTDTPNPMKKVAYFSG
ncbi:MAG: hypothetical protein EXR98_13895 [Gemmataceae bacterium]|nr:hypothetical protein [Gemmataceae bacterium]